MIRTQQELKEEIFRALHDLENDESASLVIIGDRLVAIALDYNEHNSGGQGPNYSTYFHHIQPKEEYGDSSFKPEF